MEKLEFKIVLDQDGANVYCPDCSTEDYVLATSAMISVACEGMDTEEKISTFIDNLKDLMLVMREERLELPPQQDNDIEDYDGDDDDDDEKIVAVILGKDKAGVLASGCDFKDKYSAMTSIIAAVFDSRVDENLTLPELLEEARLDVIKMLLINQSKKIADQ